MIHTLDIPYSNKKVFQKLLTFVIDDVEDWLEENIGLGFKRSW